VRIEVHQARLTAALTDNFALVTHPGDLPPGLPAPLNAPMTERDAVKIGGSPDRRGCLSRPKWRLDAPRKPARAASIWRAPQTDAAGSTRLARYAADAFWPHGPGMAGLGQSALSLRPEKPEPRDPPSAAPVQLGNCSDVKFSLAYLSRRRARQPDARADRGRVPTRLTLEADQVMWPSKASRRHASRFVGCAHICGIGSRQAAVKTGEVLASGIPLRTRLLCAGVWFRAPFGRPPP